MQMNMEDLLPGGFTISQEQIHAFTTNATGSKRYCEPLSDSHQMGAGFYSEVPKQRNVLIWDYEHMSRIDGLNIHKCCTSVIAIDKAGRLTAGEQFTDDAVTFT